jgi:4-amino-4-deoxy-L-arabinose transferase-like glycosyltransferase
MSAESRLRVSPRRIVTDWLRDPAVGVEIVLALAIAVGFCWGLPGTDSWAADSISPRSCGLGAIVETYWPGHYHHYPPLHMAVLTLLSLPWMGIAAAHAGLGRDALGAELVKPFYMTGIEVVARLVTAAMALGIARNTITLWTRLAGRRAGIAAGLLVAANAVFVFYAHTGNLDVPYVFWLTWALVELDRVACGEPREVRALLLATAAVLTKDQAAGALFLTLPVYLVLLPWWARRAPLGRRALVRGGLLSLATYALVSGALLNPIGFRDRIAHLFGPASKPEMHYAGTLAGALALARDELRTTTDFTSWPIVLFALAGAVIAAGWGGAANAQGTAPGSLQAPDHRSGFTRARLLLPLVAAVSFAWFFSFPVRQKDHRYILPESIFLAPYAALAFERAWTRWPRARAWVGAMAVASVLPALLKVASLDATLVADPRYAAERYLATFPAGAYVEVLGGPIFLPRVPSKLRAARPGVEPIEERQAIAGVTDLVDPALDPRPRAPRAIVLATELSDENMAKPVPATVPFATMQYRDPQSHAFLRALFSGNLGYERVLRSTCELSWPLECVDIHHSTGHEVWIYAPKHLLGAAR